MHTIYKQFSYLRLNILAVLEKEKKQGAIYVIIENQTADGKALMTIIASTMQQTFSPQEQSKQGMANVHSRFIGSPKHTEVTKANRNC